MSNSAGISRKADDAYPTRAPGPCSQSLVESELFIYFCYFVCIILVILGFFFVVGLFFMSGLGPWITFF